MAPCVAQSVGGLLISAGADKLEEALSSLTTSVCSVLSRLLDFVL